MTTTTAQRRVARVKRLPRGERTIDRFAGALAETGSVRAASAMIGVNYPYGKALLQRVRKELGWQAC